MRRLVLFLGLALLLACQSPFSRPDYSESLDVNLSIPSVQALSRQGGESRLISDYSSVLLIELITPDENVIRQYVNLEMDTNGYFRGKAAFENLQANVRYKVKAEARSITNQPLHLGKGEIYLAQDVDHVMDLKLVPHPEVSFEAGFRQVVLNEYLPGNGFRFFGLDVPNADAFHIYLDPPTSSEYELYFQDEEGNTIAQQLITSSTSDFTINLPEPTGRLYLSVYDNDFMADDITFILTESGVSPAPDFFAPSVSIDTDLLEIVGDQIRVDLYLDGSADTTDLILTKQLYISPDWVDIQSETVPAPALDIPPPSELFSFFDEEISAGQEYRYGVVAVDEWGNDSGSPVYSSSIYIDTPALEILPYTYDSNSNMVTVFFDDINNSATNLNLSLSSDGGLFVPEYSEIDDLSPRSYNRSLELVEPPTHIRWRLEAASPFGPVFTESPLFGNLLHFPLDNDQYQDMGPFGYIASGTGFQSQDRFGVNNGAVAFDGSNTMAFSDNALLLNPGIVEYNNQFTISFWMAIDDLDFSQGIFEMVDAGDNGIRLHYENTGDLHLTINEDDVATIPDYRSNSYPGEWKMVTIIIDGLSVDLLIDEEFQTNEPLTDLVSFAGNQPIYLGHSPSSGYANFRGKLDDLRMYSFAFHNELSPGMFDDISLLFTEGGWPAPEIINFDIMPEQINLEFEFAGRPDFMEWYVQLDREISPDTFTFFGNDNNMSMFNFTGLLPGEKYRLSAWERNSSFDRISLVREIEFHTPPNDQLMAHWAFEPGSEINDSVLGQNDLIGFDGSPTTEPDRFGGLGALGLNGVSYREAATFNPNLDIFNGGISWSFWIRTGIDSPADDRGTILSHDSLGPESTFLHIENQELAIWHDGQEVRTPLNPAEISYEWTHVVVTWDTGLSNEVHVTINGNDFRNLGDMTYASLSYASFYVGYSNEEQHFQGNLDDIRIFRRVIEPQEIEALYHERMFTSFRAIDVEP